MQHEVVSLYGAEVGPNQCLSGLQTNWHWTYEQ